MKSKLLSIRENKARVGLNQSATISLSLGNIILFKSDIIKFEKVIEMALRGGTCTYHGLTAEHNSRSNYIHLHGMGKYPLTMLQELLSKAKTVLV
jgi:hypothetical protein